MRFGNHISALRSLILFTTVSILVMVSSCKKDDNVTADNAKIEWMKVLDENVSGSTEDDRFMGQNGKVLTDANDNIYVYYFSELPKKAVVVKCDKEGALIWKKEFPDCIPMDMVIKADGHLALAVRDLPGFDNVIMMYDLDQSGSTTQHIVIQANIGGSFGVLSASMYAMPDNSIAMSGVYLSQFLVGFPENHEGFFLQLDGSYYKIWNFVTLLALSNIGGQLRFEQSSMVPLTAPHFLAQIAFTGDQAQSDSLAFGYVTLIANADSNDVDTSFIYKTGYYKQSTGAYDGFYNHYCRGIINDGMDYIHHFSAPESAFPGAPFATPVVNGFLRIGTDGMLKDTIPFDLPKFYRVISCNKGPNGFMMTAYRVGDIDVPGDFSANQTLFLVGDNNWQVTSTFRFQEFYSDFFPSASSTSDGGYVIMGKVQSFNGPQNKLILIKWKNDY